MILEPIRTFVYESCQSPQNIFGPAFFEEHLEVVRTVALELGRHYQADLEVIEISAYLHDLSAVLNPDRIKTHAEEGALFSKVYLRQLGYPDEKIEKVATAILFHSQPQREPIHGIEALCIANADVFSKAIRLPYWTSYVSEIRKLEPARGKDWMRKEILEKACQTDAFTRQKYAPHLEKVKAFLDEEA